MKSFVDEKSRPFAISSSGYDGRKAVSPNAFGSQGLTYFASKRAFDIVVSLFCIPVLIGICLVLAVLNPFWNRGPLFFLQRRVGKNGQNFWMLKFRSMSHKGCGLRRADDPLEESRITPLGRWLRDYKVDELPQVLNVLLGHMSLVGPRPEISTFVTTYKELIPGYNFRETFRPGMTGYAQVVQGYTDSIDMVRVKVDLDLFYISNASWRLDLKVLLETVGLVIFPRKAPMSDPFPVGRGAMTVEDTEKDDSGRVGRPRRLVQ